MKRPKCLIYRSSFAESMSDFFESSLSVRNYEIFCMLFYSYRVPTLLKSAYFELLRVGDRDFTLIVQKYVNDTFCVKFSYCE